MEDGFMDSRDHIDVDALVARIRERAARRGASVDGPPSELNLDGLGAGPEIADALSAQAELNEVMVGVLVAIGQTLFRMEADIAALGTRLAGEKKRRRQESDDFASLPAICRPAHESGNGSSRKIASVEPQSEHELDILLTSLRISLTSVEALLARWHR